MVVSTTAACPRLCGNQISTLISTYRSEAWMKDMTAKGEALNDSMLSQQLTWWCLDLAIWHHVPSSARIKRSALPTNAIEATRHQPTG